MPDVNILLNATDKASGPIKQVGGAIDNLSKRASGAVGTGLGQLRNALGTALTVATATGALALGGLAAAVVGTGISFDNMKQQADIAFTTMLGSGEKAKVFMDDLQAFAAATPFEFPELLQASQRLLAMGFAAEDVKPTLTAIGDAVAALGGSGELVGRVTTALGQMQAKGKASAEEMAQLTEAGIPGWKFLAEAIGTDVAGAMDQVSKGAIDAETVISALTEGMNRDFGGMMEKQSRTFGGLVSTLQDTFTQISGTVMGPLFEVLTEGLAGVVAWTSSPEFSAGVQRFTDTLTSLVNIAMLLVTGDFKGGIFGLFEDDAFIGKLFNIREGFTSVYEIARLLVTGDFRGGIFGLFEDDQFIDQLFNVRTAFIGIYQSISSLVSPVLEAITAFVSWQDVLSGLALIIGVVVVQAIVGLLVAMAPIAIVIGGAIAAMALMRNAWEKDWGGIQGKTESAVTFIRERFGALQTTVTTGGPRISSWFQEVFPGAVDAARKSFAGVTEKLQALFSTLSTAFGQMGNEVGGILNMLQTWWTNHGDAVMRIVDNTFSTVITVISATLQILISTITLALQLIQGDWEGAWGTMQTIVETIWDTIRTVIGNQLDSIKAIITAIDWAAIGRSILQGIANGITSAVSLVTDAAQRAASSAYNAAKSWLGIRSPSKRTEKEIGVPFVEGIRHGIEREMGTLSGALNLGLGNLVNGMTMPQPVFAQGSAPRQMAAATQGPTYNIEIHLQRGGYEEGKAAGEGLLDVLRFRGQGV